MYGMSVILFITGILELLFSVLSLILAHEMTFLFYKFPPENRHLVYRLANTRLGACAQKALSTHVEWINSWWEFNRTVPCSVHGCNLFIPILILHA